MTNKDVSKTRHQELSTRIIAEMMGSGPRQLIVITVVRGEASDKETCCGLGWSLAERLRARQGLCSLQSLEVHTRIFKSILELSTNHRKVSQCTEKAPSPFYN